MPFRASLLIALFSLASIFPSQADVTLPPLFGENMVLQQRASCPVWGTADAGEKVSVKLGDKTASATADAAGRWMVKLDTGKARGPVEMTVTARNTISVKNVMIGEVWLCAGGSNMAFRLANAKDAETEIAAANFPMIRMFTVDRKVADAPGTAAAGSWRVCEPKTAADMAAVAYFFARELHGKLKAPVGIIVAAAGSSPAEAWTPSAALESDPALKGIVEKWAKTLEEYPAAKAAYDQQLAGNTAPAGHPAREPRGPGHVQTPGGLFNGMIAPLIPYSLRGVAWYQGEANTGDPQLYRRLFPAMISAWRKAWSAELPFVFVQLPGFLARHADPAESLWAELREAQAGALRLPKTGMAVALDLGDEHILQPPAKQELARRLALAAERSVYGKEEAGASGPVFSAMKIKGNQAVISFRPDGGLADKDGPPLKGFQIAGEDRRWVWADGKIEGDKVILQSARVPKPVAVRYAWADFPECDLTSKTGLPAAPFRTDDWERAPRAAALPAAAQ